MALPKNIFKCVVFCDDMELPYLYLTATNNSERSDFIILSRAKRARSLLTARGLSQLRNSRLHK